MEQSNSILINYTFLLKRWAILSILTWLIIGSIDAQNELDVVHSTGAGGKDNSWLLYNDASNSLYHHLSGQAYMLLEKRDQEIGRIRTLSDWQQRQKFVRKKLMDIVGPFPEKTPLNAKTIRIIEKPFYRVEHIVFESRPGFYVTSSLFIPADLKKNSKSPAIIYCSGHSFNGYLSGGYQRVILNLVKKGFVVFAFDPVGQGERLGYFDKETNKSIFASPTKEHSYPGTQVFITGSSLARYMIWDGIRAIDYLLTRKEVDPDRIGMTGRSGGGTQSAYIAAMDDRIYAVAPECYITNFTRLLQTRGPQDAEQNMFSIIQEGLDQADLLSVRAPKPALIVTTSNDIFSIQGAIETEKEVSLIYKAYGKEGNFTRVEDIAPHASTMKNREATYAFFQKHLNNPGESNDEAIETLTAEEMRVTATGQVSTSLGGETVYSLNCKEAEKLVSNLNASRKDLPVHLPLVVNSAKKISAYIDPSGFNEPVLTGRVQREGYMIEKYFVKGEGDYIIPYLLMLPVESNNKALIYLHPSGKSAEAGIGGEMEWFVNKGFTVLAPDMLGLGETGPGDFRLEANIDGVSHFIWYGAILIGRSIAGTRTGDVVRLVRLLKVNGKITEVFGVAKKEMGPVMLHAGAFESAITRIALIEPYSSYRSIIMSRFYDSSFIHGVVPGAIKAYDLPDLAASLAPRKLLMAGVTDGSGKKTDVEGIKKDMIIIETAYKTINAEGMLHISDINSNEKPYDLYMEWIK